MDAGNLIVNCSPGGSWGHKLVQKCRDSGTDREKSVLKEIEELQIEFVSLKCCEMKKNLNLVYRI